MHMRRIGLFLLLAALGAGFSVTGAEVEPATKIIARLKAVGNEGKGNQDAAVAWKELVKLGPDALLPILSSMNEVGPVAENWLRTATDAISETEKKANRSLPLEKLETFVKESKNSSIGRRLAYELLADADPKTPDRLLGGMLDDPNADLRRDAVERAFAKIEKSAPDAAKEYRHLFDFTRDKDQVDKVVKELSNLGVKVSPLEHFNVIDQWMIVGPFDSPKGEAYGKPLPPEEKVDLTATYVGKNKQEVKWQVYWSFDLDGLVELNDVIGKYKDAVSYAYVAFESPEERPAEVRFGSIVAVEAFVNGKKAFAREEYHHDQRFDQYVVPVKLKKGKNELLLKILQNNQAEPWAQSWTFQSVRICDATGGKIPLKQLTAQ
jgi:hypothetical protein